MSTRATPGYKGSVSVDNNVMSGVTSANLDFGTDDIESGSFGDTYEQTVSGLGNTSMSLDFIFDEDDVAQDAIMQGALPGDDPQVEIEYIPDDDGALTFSFDGRVDSVSLSQDHDDRIEVSADIVLAEGVLTITTA